MNTFQSTGLGKDIARLHGAKQLRLKASGGVVRRPSYSIRNLLQDYLHPNTRARAQSASQLELHFSDGKRPNCLKRFWARLQCPGRRNRTTNAAFGRQTFAIGLKPQLSQKGARA
jgi:hypothetical protein